MIRFTSITALIAAEGVAIYVVAEWFASGYSGLDPDAVGAWAFILVALVAYWMPDFLRGLGFEERNGQTVAAVSGVLLLYAILRIEFAHDFALWDLGWAGDFLDDPDAVARAGSHLVTGGLLLMVTWVRASFKATDEIELETVSRKVALPFAVVTLVVVFAAAGDRGAEAGRGAILFYGLEVLALACSQLALSGATIGEVRAGGVISVILGVTVGTVVVGLLVLSLALTFLGPIVGPPLEAVLNAVLTVILTPLAWALEKIFRAFAGDGNPFANLARPPTTFEQAKDAAASEHGHPFWYDAGVFVLRGALLVIIIAVAGGSIWLVTKLRKRALELKPAAADSASTGSLGDDARALLRSLFRGGAKRDSGRSSGIMRLYEDVLERAEHDARPRLAGETANEFAPVLSEAFSAGVTDDITATFVEARYAGREPDPRVLAELERRWHAIR